MADIPDWKLRFAMEKHATQIGYVTLFWNDAHDLVYHIFEDASGMGEEMAKALFHTLRSDAGQRDLTLAAVRVRLGDATPRLKALKTIFSKIGQCASARNEAIHTSWAHDIFEIVETGQMFLGGIGKRPRHAGNDGDHEERFNKLREDLKVIYADLLEWRREPFPETTPSPKHQQDPS